MLWKGTFSLNDSLAEALNMTFSEKTLETFLGVAAADFDTTIAIAQPGSTIWIRRVE